MKARLNGTKDPFVEITEVSLADKPYVVYDANKIEFEQEKTQQDNTMAFTLMRDIEQVSFISKEGKDERISWLNSLEDRFSNQESNKYHWQDVRERAAIAVLPQCLKIIQDVLFRGGSLIEETITKQAAVNAVEYADALVKKLKGE